MGPPDFSFMLATYDAMIAILAYEEFVQKPETPVVLFEMFGSPIAGIKRPFIEECGSPLPAGPIKLFWSWI